MQTDTYYRGYRLTDGLNHGHIHIHHEADFVGTADDLADAKAQIDSWLVAR